MYSYVKNLLNEMNASLPRGSLSRTSVFCTHNTYSYNNPTDQRSALSAGYPSVRKVLFGNLRMEWGISPKSKSLRIVGCMWPVMWSRQIQSSSIWLHYHHLISRSKIRRLFSTLSSQTRHPVKYWFLHRTPFTTTRVLITRKSLRYTNFHIP